MICFPARPPGRDDEDEDEGPVTGLVATGELLGEKPENMINLPLIKKEEHQVGVV